MKLSERLSSIAPSMTLQITAKAKELKAKGEDVISFGAGEPDFDTPQYIKQAAIDALNKGMTKYTVASGMVELKEAIVAKFKNDNKIEYSANQIIVSCGAKHSLFNAFQAILNEGDEVIIPAPYWLSYPEMVKCAGGVPIYLETKMENGFKLDVSDLKKAITPRTKALIINSPSNPTGGVYEEDELLEIANVVKNYNIFVVSDEIYEKLVYDDFKFTSIASLDDEIKKHTITVNGLSKAYSMTGWRLGYLACDANVAKVIAAYQSHSTSNPTSFAQYGGLAALTQTDTSEIDAMRVSFEKRRNIMYDIISSMKKITAFKPTGAFYMFCDISATGMKAMEFASKLLTEAKVAVIPGESFGSDKHIRLSFATSEKNIKNGLARISDWIGK
ncbi:MAG: pyridoxal phosphate-dependent aminotransferase [Candidatus Omnitrophica bacterium]|nr:pyridoxal phosphate-dependent aminotransferase [Candidatus Omnitrophota bacterium]